MTEGAIDRDRLYGSAGRGMHTDRDREGQRDTPDKKMMRETNRHRKTERERERERERGGGGIKRDGRDRD